MWLAEYAIAYRKRVAEGGGGTTKAGGRPRKNKVPTDETIAETFRVAMAECLAAKVVKSSQAKGVAEPCFWL